MSSSEVHDWRSEALVLYEDNLAQMSSRPLWDVYGRTNDLLRDHKLRQQIREEQRKWEAEQRLLSRERIAHDAATARSALGDSVLRSRHSIDVSQKINYRRPQVDYQALKNIIDEQAAAQRLVDQARSWQQMQDFQRRQQLLATGTPCPHCGDCRCQCPIPQLVVREPIRDVPTTIPLVMQADLQLEFDYPGYDQSQITREPPPTDLIYVAPRAPLATPLPAIRAPVQHARDPVNDLRREAVVVRQREASAQPPAASRSPIRLPAPDHNCCETPPDPSLPAIPTPSLPRP